MAWMKNGIWNNMKSALPIFVMLLAQEIVPNNGVEPLPPLQPFGPGGFVMPGVPPMPPMPTVPPVPAPPPTPAAAQAPGAGQAPAASQAPAAAQAPASSQAQQPPPVTPGKLPPPVNSVPQEYRGSSSHENGTSHELGSKEQHDAVTPPTKSDSGKTEATSSPATKKHEPGPGHAEQDKKQDQPAHAGHDKKQDQPALAGQDKKQDQPALAGQDKKQDQPAHAGQEKKQDQPAHAGQDKKQDQPAHAGQDKKQDQPAHAGQAKKHSPPGSAGENKHDAPSHVGQGKKHHPLSHPRKTSYGHTSSKSIPSGVGFYNTSNFAHNSSSSSFSSGDFMAKVKDLDKHTGKMVEKNVTATGYTGDMNSTNAGMASTFFSGKSKNGTSEVEVQGKREDAKFNDEQSKFGGGEIMEAHGEAKKDDKKSGKS